MRVTNFTIEPEFETDSLNYDVIVEGIERIKDVDGFTCEIGLRRGGGSFHIIDTLFKTEQKKTHIAIDPYGNIEYPEGDDEQVIRCDYTNSMRDDCLANMYLLCQRREISFLFFNLEDTEFFARYADGVPVYNEHKQLVNQYSFVHFDGPHTVRHLKTEIDFFHPRSPQGAVWVFDDVGLYKHSETHAYLKSLGWSALRTTERKWSYQRK